MVEWKLFMTCFVACISLFYVYRKIGEVKCTIKNLDDRVVALENMPRQPYKNPYLPPSVAELPMHDTIHTQDTVTLPVDDASSIADFTVSAGAGVDDDGSEDVTLSLADIINQTMGNDDDGPPQEITTEEDPVMGQAVDICTPPDISSGALSHAQCAWESTATVLEEHAMEEDAMKSIRLSSILEDVVFDMNEDIKDDDMHFESQCGKVKDVDGLPSEFPRSALPRKYDNPTFLNKHGVLSELQKRFVEAWRTLSFNALAAVCLKKGISHSTTDKTVVSCALVNHNIPFVFKDTEYFA